MMNQRLKSFYEYYNQTCMLHEGTMSKLLQQTVDNDQAERNAYEKFVLSDMDGDWGKGATAWAKRHNRPHDDIFGDKWITDSIIKVFNKNPRQFIASLSSKKDWDNLFLISQHADHNIEFQKTVLAALKLSPFDQTLNIQYLTDRITKAQTGRQKYGTQNLPFQTRPTRRKK